jgi:hypothetical protein
MSVDLLCLKNTTCSLVSFLHTQTTTTTICATYRVTTPKHSTIASILFEPYLVCRNHKNIPLTCEIIHTFSALCHLPSPTTLNHLQRHSFNYTISTTKHLLLNELPSKLHKVSLSVSPKCMFIHPTEN